MVLFFSRENHELAERSGDTSDFREKKIKPRELPRDRTQKQRYYVEETKKTRQPFNLSFFLILTSNFVLMWEF